MKGLVKDEGKYRTSGVGIFKGSKAAHIAPPAWNVGNLMNGLFEYLKKSPDSPVFEYLPIEHVIKSKQKEYYRALALSDKASNCTLFIEYMLQVIKESLEGLISNQRAIKTSTQRIIYFVDNFGENKFVRKDYLQLFKNISTATASRDLKKGIELGYWIKNGEDRLSRYEIVKKM